VTPATHTTPTNMPRPTAIQVDLDETLTRAVANRVVAKLERALLARPKVLVLRIHCNGGSIYEALRVIDTLERVKAQGIIVATVVQVIAFSVAVPIYCVGTDGFRFASPHAYMMIHRPQLRVPPPPPPPQCAPPSSPGGAATAAPPMSPVVYGDHHIRAAPPPPRPTAPPRVPHGQHAHLRSIRAHMTRIMLGAFTCPEPETGSSTLAICLL
jgi:hypothetical protein